MDAHEEWVYWADEDLVTNFGYAKGLYPKMIRNTFPTRYTKLYYCYYTPQGRKLQTSDYLVTSGKCQMLLMYLLTCFTSFCCSEQNPEDSVDGFVRYRWHSRWDNLDLPGTLRDTAPHILPEERQRMRGKQRRQHCQGTHVGRTSWS